MKDEKILSAGGYAKRTKGTRSPALPVVFPAEMLERIREIAKRNGVSAGEIVRIACDQYLRRGAK
jgi:allophanate hydrolase subunit 1